MSADADLDPQIEPVRGLSFEAAPDRYKFRIAVDSSGLKASADLPWYYVDFDELAAFFIEIDRDWRGWEGQKQFGGPGQPLSMTATHDGLGHVQLWVEFGDEGTTWMLHYRVRAVFAFEVGRALVIASVIGDWVQRTRPDPYY